ncbi:MAG: RsmE family RNA methyltransferase, partial [Cetobacterium sp.]
DLTIQKLTEIGITKIIPLVTARGVVKLNEKKEKWDLISREAIKQCQAVKMMEIEETMKLKDIDFSSYDLIVVPYECEEDKTLRNLLNGLKEQPKKILYIVGPEGGFTTEEIEFLKNQGANIVTLGRRILRAETASIVVGGVLINEYQ